MKSEIAIINKTNLTDGQRCLYGVICEKLKSDTPIYAEEAVKMWLENVSRANFINGEPHTYEYYGRYDDIQKKWVPCWRKLSDWEIKTRSITWLMAAIGALVLKGYLKIIPQLEIDG